MTDVYHWRWVCEDDESTERGDWTNHDEALELGRAEFRSAALQDLPFDRLWLERRLIGPVERIEVDSEDEDA